MKIDKFKIQLGAKIMVWFFVFITLLAVVLMVWFVWKNDASSETLEIIYPLVGASFFFIYIWYKAIFITPKNTKIKDFAMLVIVNTHTGRYTTLVPFKYKNDGEILNKSFYMRVIQNYQDDLMFKQEKKFNNLKKVRASDTYESENFLTDIIEKHFIDWLINHNIRGSIDTGDEVIGFAGGMKRLETPSFTDKMQAVPIIFNPNEENNLVPSGTQLDLPVGSTFRRKKGEGMATRIYTIETPYSIVNMSINLVQLGNFQAAPSPLKQKIEQVIDFDWKSSENFDLTFFAVFNFEQKIVSRFSERSKWELKWFDNLMQKFKYDFSWEIVKSKIEEF